MIRALLLIAATVLAAPAAARVPEVRAELLPGWRMADGRHMAAIRLTLPPGWKTYWRSPGGAGIPPMADWSGSRGIAGAQILWPAPDVFRSFGMHSLGYEGTVVLPVAVRPSGARPALELGFAFGICEEICVPMSVRLTAELPRGGAADPAILIALARVPRPASGVATCHMGESRGRTALVATLSVPSLGPGESVALEAPGAHLGEPSIRREGGRLTASFPVDGGAVSRQGLRVTAFGPAGALEQVGCPSP